MPRRPNIDRYDLLQLVEPSVRSYSIAETAIILNAGYDSVRELIRAGKLRAHQIPEGTGYWKISETAIREYIDAAEGRVAGGRA